MEVRSQRENRKHLFHRCAFPLLYTLRTSLNHFGFPSRRPGHLATTVRRSATKAKTLRWTSLANHSLQQTAHNVSWKTLNLHSFLKSYQYQKGPRRRRYQASMITSVFPLNPHPHLHHLHTTPPQPPNTWRSRLLLAWLEMSSRLSLNRTRKVQDVVSVLWCRQCCFRFQYWWWWWWWWWR